MGKQRKASEVQSAGEDQADAYTLLGMRLEKLQEVHALLSQEPGASSADKNRDAEEKRLMQSAIEFLERSIRLVEASLNPPGGTGILRPISVQRGKVRGGSRAPRKLARGRAPPAPTAPSTPGYGSFGQGDGNFLRGRILELQVIRDFVIDRLNRSTKLNMESRPPAVQFVVSFFSKAIVHAESLV